MLDIEIFLFNHLAGQSAGKLLSLLSPTGWSPKLKSFPNPAYKSTLAESCCFVQTAGGKASALSLVILSRTVFCSTDDTSSQILSLHFQSRVLSILKIDIFKVDIGKLRAGLRERIVGFFMKYLAAHFVTFFNDSLVIIPKSWNTAMRWTSYASNGKLRVDSPQMLWVMCTIQCLWYNC